MKLSFREPLRKKYGIIWEFFPKCPLGKNSQIIPYFFHNKNTGIFGSFSQVDTWEKLPNNTVFFLRGSLSIFCDKFFQCLSPARGLDTKIFSQQHEQILPDGNRAGFLIGETFIVYGSKISFFDLLL